MHIELVIQKLTELSDWLGIGNVWGHKQRVDDAIKELSQPDLSELKRRQLKMLLSKKVLFHPKCLGDVAINDFGDGTNLAWQKYLNEIADVCPENL